MIKFWGKVKLGQKRGKSLGFPTANINLHKRIPEGIYISWVTLNKQKCPSLTFIGKNVTFKETLYQAESHILDFDKNIYNAWISVELIKRVRKNKKFQNVNDLIKEMKNDKKIARKYFR